MIMFGGLTWKEWLVVASVGILAMVFPLVGASAVFFALFVFPLVLSIWILFSGRY